MSAPASERVETCGLRCLDCGARYGYLGSGTHPGVCIACGSRTVSPAGRLVVTEHVRNPGADEIGLPGMILLVAQDESGRTFEFWFRDDGDAAVLNAVEIAGTVVAPRQAADEPALFAEPIRRVLRDRWALDAIRVPGEGVIGDE